MPRRTMAQRKRNTADRNTRRDSLLALLSRMGCDALLDAEKPLLRALVEVEIDEATDLRRTIAGQQDGIQQNIRQLDAAHRAIEEAEARAKQAEDAIERVKNLRTIAPAGAQGPTWAALDLAIRDALDQAPAAEETHVVTDDSDEPEHVDDCPGCEEFTLVGHIAMQQPTTTA